MWLRRTHSWKGNTGSFRKRRGWDGSLPIIVGLLWRCNGWGKLVAEGCCCRPHSAIAPMGWSGCDRSELAPERGHEEDENSEEFEAAEGHEEGHDEAGGCAEDGERIGGADIAKTGADIEHGGEGG